MTTVLILLALSLLQGFTEVLPISSSGHLALFKQLAGLDDVNLALVAGLHAGSLLAIVIYFRRDFARLWLSLRSSWRDVLSWVLGRGANPFARPGEARVPYYLAASLVPLAIEGLALRDVAGSTFSSELAAPLLLVLNGLVILAVAHWTRGERSLHDLALWEYLVIGAVQGFAVLPGISRLGLTLCAGLWRRLNWHEALRMAFILAVPAILGGLLVQASAMQASLDFLAGLPVVVLASLIGLRTLMSSLLERRTLTFFGAYCCTAGLFGLSYLLTWM